MTRTKQQDQQRGSVTLEYVIGFPVLLIVLFGAVQTGLYFHTRNIAITAAQEGARTAAMYDSSANAGKTAAEQLLAHSGTQNATVSVDRSETVVNVIVEVASPNILDGLLPTLTIQQTASMPTERVT